MTKKNPAAAKFSSSIGRHIALRTLSKMAATSRPQARPRLLRDALLEIVEIQKASRGSYPLRPAFDSFARVLCFALAGTYIKHLPKSMRRAGESGHGDSIIATLGAGNTIAGRRVMPRPKFLPVDPQRDEL